MGLQNVDEKKNIYFFLLCSNRKKANWPGVCYQLIVAVLFQISSFFLLKSNGCLLRALYVAYLARELCLLR